MTLAACAWLRFDVPARPDRPVVVFIGHWSRERDPTFDYFVSVVRKQQPRLAERAVFEFLATPDNDDTEVARLLALRVARPVALVVAPNGGSALVARRVAPGVPLVFASFLDPLRDGIVVDMRSRTAPVTGISVADWLDGKRLEILHEAYPAIRRVGVLGDASWVANFDVRARLPLLGAHEGLEVRLFVADTDAQAKAALAEPAAAGVDAWYVPATYVGLVARGTILSTMRERGRPCIFASTQEVEAGGLMAYAQDTDFAWPALAELVARVLDGERPGDIPIVRPHRFVLALRTGPDTRVPPPAIGVVRRADVVLR